MSGKHLTMTERERRRGKPQPFHAMIAGLSPEQRAAARDLLQFGWQLRFVRRKPFHPALMFFYEPERKVWGVVAEDGKLQENPDLRIREDDDPAADPPR